MNVSISFINYLFVIQIFIQNVTGMYSKLYKMTSRFLIYTEYENTLNMLGKRP